MKHQGNNLKRDEYSVSDKIPMAELVSIIKKFHYAKNCSNAAVESFGLVRNLDGAIVGAAIFMAVRKSTAKSLWCGDHRRVLSLSRLAIDPMVPRNGASFFLGGILRILRSSNKYDCLITYADTWQNHSGAIYKATNWEYLGITRPREKWVNGEGRLSSRKQGRRWRSYDEMAGLGYQLVGKSVKHRFRLVL